MPNWTQQLIEALPMFKKLIDSTYPDKYPYDSHTVFTKLAEGLKVGYLKDYEAYGDTLPPEYQTQQHNQQAVLKAVEFHLHQT